MVSEKHDIRTLYGRFQELRQIHASDNQVYLQLCREFGYNDVSSLRRRVIKHMRSGEDTQQYVSKRVNVPLPRPETYVYRGQTPKEAIPVFTGAEHLHLDEVMVTGDLHLPTTKFWFLERMCKVADRHMRGHRTLLICGDLVNGDRDSNHPRNYPTASRANEFRYAEETIDYLLGFYDDIIMMPGNHFRNRLFTVLEGDVDMDQALRLLTPRTDRVFLTAYDYIQVTSAGQTWTFTHQYAYSTNKLIKANELAQKYQTNIATFHQHHTAVGMDKYGRYVVMDIGGMHDSDQMGYVNLVPNTMPVMNSGFCLLRKGVGHLLSTHPGFTDWSLWLDENDLRTESR